MSNRLFTSVKVKRPKRNVFDLSHERKLSFNMGDLVPIFLEEVVPGDSFRLNTELFIRLAPMLAPMMHRVNVYTHFFYVPNRLVFDKWQDFITGGVDGQDETVFPNFNVFDTPDPTLFLDGSLSDYLGLPSLPAVPPSPSFSEFFVNSLPFRSYQLIYNEFYRDQTLTPEVVFGKGSTVSSADIGSICKLRRRSWEKDYFTSALPWPQRGADVLLPLGESAPVVFDGFPIGNPPEFVNSVGSRVDIGDLQSTRFPMIPGSPYGIGSSGAPTQPLGLDPRGSLQADLSDASSSTINEWRRALRLQEWLEKNARAGSRYIEQILSHFGVRSSDARLQRPEFLGGGKSPVVISEVLQTSASDDVTPQGNMSGHGVAVGNTHGFKKFFEEHGFVIGIMSVLPRTAYFQGVPKKFFKSDKFDYFWPSFAHLGEQPILNKELYVSSDADVNESTFGYTPRYAEYKYAPNTVHGDFRSNMSYWHMARSFSSRPNLNAAFVSSDPTHRIFAVTDPSVHKLYAQVYHNCKAIRPMPKFGTPTL
ncbi:MAG: hypothetical protein LBF69_05605 [Prevotellaceae bacterium]|jgi:hypothetical protein|nr:hypothetical protein [Prevotellaceae bacterium]